MAQVSFFPQQTVVGNQPYDESVDVVPSELEEVPSARVIPAIEPLPAAKKLEQAAKLLKLKGV